MKTNRIIYWTATGLLSALMLFSAGMYLFNQAAVEQSMRALGYPTFLIYPHAIVKILGVIAILTNRSVLLKEWAYAGFFFDFVLAAASSMVAGVPGGEVALFALVLLIVSRIYSGRVRNSPQTCWPVKAAEATG